MYRQRQDHILIDGAINQDPVWPMTSLKLAADEVLLAVADRVSTNNVPRRASRIVLEELAGWSGNSG